MSFISARLKETEHACKRTENVKKLVILVPSLQLRGLLPSNGRQGQKGSSLVEDEGT